MLPVWCFNHYGSANFPFCSEPEIAVLTLYQWFGKSAIPIYWFDNSTCGVIDVLGQKIHTASIWPHKSPRLWKTIKFSIPKCTLPGSIVLHLVDCFVLTLWRHTAEPANVNIAVPTLSLVHRWRVLCLWRSLDWTWCWILVADGVSSGERRLVSYTIACCRWFPGSGIIGLLFSCTNSWQGWRGRGVQTYWLYFLGEQYHHVGRISNGGTSF